MKNFIKSIYDKDKELAEQVSRVLIISDTYEDDRYLQDKKKKKRGKNIILVDKLVKADDLFWKKYKPYLDKLKDYCDKVEDKELSESMEEALKLYIKFSKKLQNSRFRAFYLM